MAYTGTPDEIKKVLPRVTQETVVTTFDKPLLYTTLALVGFGLMAVYSASANQAVAETGMSFSILLKQCLAVAIGFTVMMLTSRMHFTWWKKLALPAAAVSIALLIYTMFFGTTSNGAERWIMLPFGFQFQPSEVAKVASILLLAHVASERWYRPSVWLNIVLIGVMIGLIHQQPNLSVAMILGFVTLIMLYISGMHLIIFALGLPALGSVVWEKIMSTPYQKARIDGWLDPWEAPMTSGYNLIQSYFAIGSGGFLGVGLGRSIQKLYYLPFQHTDFIFSVICEELGFMGALILIGLFVHLAWRGFSIALNCPHQYGQMLAFGLTTTLVLQALINLCVTTGLMPVTGVTLPLISYGGTSMIVTLAMIGILLNISRYRKTARLG